MGSSKGFRSKKFLFLGMVRGGALKEEENFNAGDEGRRGKL